VNIITMGLTRRTEAKDGQPIGKERRGELVSHMEEEALAWEGPSGC
jgi:hypothetical protein